MTFYFEIPACSIRDFVEAPTETDALVAIARDYGDFIDGPVQLSAVD